MNCPYKDIQNNQDMLNTRNEKLVNNRSDRSDRREQGCYFCNRQHVVSVCPLLKHNQTKTRVSTLLQQGAKDNARPNRGCCLCNGPHLMRHCYRRTQSSTYANLHKAGNHDDFRGQIFAMPDCGR